MKKGKVVITHGLFMSSMVMRPLARMLNRHGWEPVLISYQSTSIHFQSFASEIDQHVKRQTSTPIHMVGHSLGGLMLRKYCEERPMMPGARVVTLGTPHQGAHIVSRLKRLRLDGIIGNSREHGLVSEKPSVWRSTTELATIAGNVDTGLLNLLGGQLPHERSDGIVLVDETKIPGSKAHVELNVSHTTMIYSRIVAEHIDRFLERGSF